MTKEEKTIIYFKALERLERKELKPKQVLKETIKLWINTILALVSFCIILVVVPFLFFTHAGIGYLQLNVFILWSAFWLCFLATVVEKMW